MKSQADIQHAHDVLVAELGDQADYLIDTDQSKRDARAALTVLCWVLGCNHWSGSAEADTEDLVVDAAIVTLPAGKPTGEPPEITA